MIFDSITNRGEFFSNHYLDAVIGNDLGDLRSRWDRTSGVDVTTLALSRDLLDHFAALEKRIRDKVSQIAGVFQRLNAEELREHRGLHLERYAGQLDPRARTIRITDNFRGIVCDTGDNETYILCAILPHKEADRWMARNTFRVNAITGALEIRDIEAIEAVATQLPASAATSDRLFAHRKDKDFTQLGIDEDLVAVIRLITSENQLQGLLGVLSQAQSDALILLTGNQSVEEIFAEIAGAIEPGSIDEDDLVAALRAPASHALFHVVNDEHELQEMLARPLAQWRTFLHHTQNEIAYKPTYTGPARVTGGAGTGKTVVAMHRASFLAKELAEPVGKPILFTTFTRNLARSIESDLRELGGADLLDAVEVVNVDSLAFRLVREAEPVAPAVILDERLAELWQEVSDELGSSYRSEFLANEWEQVILALGCRSRDEYFRASRAGRGIRLDRRGRADVWKAVEAFTQRLVEAGQQSYLQMADAAAGHLGRRALRPYEHVIVDEAQDLHEAQWRMLRAVVDEGPNDMFIVGDSHQRIYDRRSSLSKVGINIRGRSRRLRINYRTTHEIMRWSLSLLGDELYDDLDEGADEHTFAGYHSFLHGPEPTAVGCGTKKAELDALVEQLTSWIADGVNEEDIGVCARASGSFDAIEAACRAGGIAVCVLEKELPSAEGVRLGTMHRFKGLEFRCVAVFDVDDDTLPSPWAVTDASADEVQHELDLRRERCLLYVACTRARENLWLGWSGRPSRFLEPRIRS